jgi:hypothetical protein
MMKVKVVFVLKPVRNFYNGPRIIDLSVSYHLFLKPWRGWWIGIYETKH